MDFSRLYAQSAQALQQHRALAATTARASIRPQSVAAANAMGMAISRLREDRAYATQMLRQMGQLREVRNVVATEGMSRGLRKLIDPKGTNPFFSSTPTYEHLDAVALPPTDRHIQADLIRLTIALESEGAMVGQWLIGTIANICEIFEALRTQVSEAMDAGAAFRDAVVSVDPEVLTRISVVSTTAEARLSLVTTLIEVTKGVQAPDFDISDEGSLAAARQALSELVGHLTDMTGAVYTEDGLVVVQRDAIAAEHLASEGTLSDKGYTTENLVELLDRLDELAGALMAMADRESAIVQRIQAVCAAVSATTAEPEPVAEPEADAAPAAGEDETATDAAGETVTPPGDPSAENFDEDAFATTDDDASSDKVREDDRVEPGEGGEVTDPGEGEGASTEGLEDGLSRLEATRVVMSGWISLLMLVAETGVACLSDGLTIADAIVNGTDDEAQTAQTEEGEDLETQAAEDAAGTEDTQADEDAVQAPEDDTEGVEEGDGFDDDL